MAFWSDPSALFPKQSHRWVVSFSDILAKNKKSIAEIPADDRIPHYFAKSVDKPSYEIGSIQTKYLYSHTVNFPKRLTWKPIKIEFYDLQVMTGNMILNEPIKDNKDYSKKDSMGEIKYSTQVFFYTLLSKAGYFQPDPTTPAADSLHMASYTFKKNLLTAFVGGEPDLLDEDLTTDRQDTLSIPVKSMYITELDGNGINIETWEVVNPLVTAVNFNKLDYSSDNVLSITVDLVYDFARLLTPVEQVKTKNPESPDPEPRKSRSNPYASFEATDAIKAESGNPTNSSNKPDPFAYLYDINEGGSGEYKKTLPQIKSPPMAQTSGPDYSKKS